MNIIELEELSVEEMAQVKGGKIRLVWIDGQWIWVDDGEDDDDDDDDTGDYHLSTLFQ